MALPFTVEKDFLFATDKFVEGDLVVKISYYKLENKDVEGGFRAYSLLSGTQHERMIHVSSLVRLQGLKFSPGPSGPQGRAMRSGVTRLFYLSRDAHNSIESTCYE